MSKNNNNINNEEIINAVLRHEEPICPICHKGRLVCPNGKVEKPHFFVCTNECGWYMNVDYVDPIIE